MVGNYYRSLAGILGHLQEWRFEPRLRGTVTLFEIRNRSRVPGEEIGIAASQSSSEKIGVADGIFRKRDVIGRDGNPEGEGKKHSERRGPSLGHCLARMKDVFCRWTVTAKSKSRHSKLPHGG